MITKTYIRSSRRPGDPRRTPAAGETDVRRGRGGQHHLPGRRRQSAADCRLVQRAQHRAPLLPSIQTGTRTKQQVNG